MKINQQRLGQRHLRFALNKSRADGGASLMAVIVLILLAMIFSSAWGNNALTQSEITLKSRTEQLARNTASSALSEADYQLNEGRYKTPGPNGVSIDPVTDSNAYKTFAPVTENNIVYNGHWRIAKNNTNPLIDYTVTSYGVAERTSTSVRNSSERFSNDSRMSRNYLTFLTSSVSGQATATGTGLTYNVSPSGAFRHAVFGASGVTSDPVSTSTNIAGSVASAVGSVHVRKVPTEGTVLYSSGMSASATTRCVDISKCGLLTPVSTGVTIDPGIKKTYANCHNTSSTYDLVIGGSEGGRTDPADTVICARNVTVNGNWNITGTGRLVVFVSGNLTFTENASLNAPNASPTFIVGSTDTASNTYKVQMSGKTAGSQRIKSFIYAPEANCRIGGTAASQLEITGSIACNTVRLGGVKSIATTAFSPRSTGLYDPDSSFQRKIWVPLDTSTIN